MSELKRCPFCGKEQQPDVPGDGNVPYVNQSRMCDWCGCCVGSNWNTRPIEDALQHRIEELEAELKITDELLKEATETIGAVIACCTYNSNDDAKIGIYGIDQKAFTRIDQFITHYNDAVSAGKVSVDVKRELSDAEINELGAQEAEKRG